MTKPLFSTIAAFALSTATVSAAEIKGAIFEKLAGDWSSQGKAFGAEAVSTMTWEPALSGRFYRLDYRIEMTREDGVQTFEGVGYYRALEESVSGYWADSTGDLHPITAKVTEDALTSHWGRAGGKQGRTEYRFLGDSTVEVTDWLLTAEGWRQFNKGIFQRAPE